jgi:hypothetical protein
MTRSPDQEVPANETLYRSIAKDHFVEGVGVLAPGVEMPACSFNRSKYSAPEDVTVSSRPRENGIAEITPAELPPPIPRTDATPYEFFAADDPTDDNGAHCEVRICRTGTVYTPSHKPNAAIKLKAREALARQLRVRRPPT